MGTPTITRNVTVTNEVQNYPLVVKGLNAKGCSVRLSVASNPSSISAELRRLVLRGDPAKRLDGLDVRSLLALGARSDVKRDALAFLERLEA